MSADIFRNVIHCVTKMTTHTAVFNNFYNYTQ